MGDRPAMDMGANSGDEKKMAVMAYNQIRNFRKSKKKTNDCFCEIILKTQTKQGCSYKHPCFVYKVFLRYYETKSSNKTKKSK